MNEHLLLYSANVPVNGKNRSAIYCLSAGKLLFIPNSFYSVIQEMRISPLAVLREKYADDIDTFNEYCDFILDQDIGFIVDDPSCFPALDIQYHSPEIIQSALMEIAGFGRYDVINVLDQLESLNCKCLEIRMIDDGVKNARILELLEATRKSSLRSIDVLIKYDEQIDMDFLRGIFSAYKKISSILIFNAPYQWKINADGLSIGFSKDRYEELSNISPSDLYINMEFFMEAHFYNPYLHKKIAVSESGAIKNCLHHQRVFGNVKQDLLFDVARSSEFQELWHTCVDRIEVVKYSEIRYACLIVEELERIDDNGQFRLPGNSPYLSVDLVYNEASV
jgi:SPASM domain peptide maturase of grasp-with-spasm system